MATAIASRIYGDRDSAPAPLDPLELTRPRWAEAGTLATLALFYVAARNIGDAATQLMNLIGPMVLIAALGISVVTMIRRSISLLWAPLLWARIALIAYYGAGSVVPYLANNETRELLESFYYFFPEDVAKYNLVCDIFALMFVTSSILVSNALLWLKSNRANSRSSWKPAQSHTDTLLIGIVFLVSGGIANYIFIMPFNFGLTGTPPPSIISQIALLSNAGYYIVGSWALREKPPIFYLIVALAFLEFFFGLLSMTKTVAMLPPIMLGVALIQHSPTLKRIIIVSITIWLIYAAISPIVAYGRNALSRSYGSIISASLADRFDIITSYTPERAKGMEDSQVQMAWARLSYVNSGTFAINQYDAGRPGHSLDYFLIVLVPRFIYPDKPIITDVGKDFNVAVNGNENSASSPGIPSEFYWNFGWIGVIFGGFFIGALMSIYSIYSTTVAIAEAWYLMPVILLGMRIATRMDGFLVQDFIGPIMVAVLAHMALVFLNSLAQKKR